jgi:uncharacterized membrane protein HdeD (DUF308 family)
MKKYFAPRLLITTAIVWLLIGTCVYVSDRDIYLLADRFASVALLIDSFVLVAVACTSDAGINERKWMVALATVSGFSSILLLLDPFSTSFVFALLVTAWIVGKGFLTMIAALAIRSNNHKWRGDVAGGCLLICFGLLIPHNPLGHVYRLNLLLGATAWTIGLLYVYDAYRLQNINPSFPGSHLR